MCAISTTGRPLTRLVFEKEVRVFSLVRGKERRSANRERILKLREFSLSLSLTNTHTHTPVKRRKLLELGVGLGLPRAMVDDDHRGAVPVGRRRGIGGRCGRRHQKRAAKLAIRPQPSRRSGDRRAAAAAAAAAGGKSALTRRGLEDDRHREEGPEKSAKERSEK